MMENKQEDKNLIVEVAKEIRDICKKSPEHANAIVDLIGYDTYLKTLHIAK